MYRQRKNSFACLAEQLPLGTRTKRGHASCVTGGSDPHDLFWAAESRKSGVAPAQSGTFFCVTLLMLVSFISSFSRDICASQAEEDAEDEGSFSYFLPSRCSFNK